MTKLHFIAIPLLASCLLLGACGGSSGPKAPVARGPADFRTNVTRILHSSEPTLKNIQSDCPHARPAKFPVVCHMTADAPAVRVSHSLFKANPKLARLLSKPHKVAGTIRVLGIVPATQTYEVEAQFAPVQ